MSEQTDREFNLLHESWICVLDENDEVKEISLTEALVDANKYKKLAGECVPQDVAVLRLMLAVLQTVFYRYDENGNEAKLETEDDAYDRWEYAWEKKCFREDVIKQYLNEWEDRFWLFDKERPFYQIPEAVIGTQCSSAKLNGLISESDNKIRIFANRSGNDKDNLSYQEAARWLLFVNGYDDTASKPKQKGLPSTGAGWLGKLGLIYAVGEDLFETLMLNLVLLDENNECWTDPKPAWELTNPRKEERTEISMPDNQAELLTLQSRRILLKRENGYVVGYSLLGGDFFSAENAIYEQMTEWKADKKSNSIIIKPKRHNSEKLAWRDFAAIVSPENEQGRKPGIVSWLKRLSVNKIIDIKKIALNTTAVQYGDKDFFITDFLGDYINFKSDLLKEENENWVRLVNAEIEKFDKAAEIVWGLSADIAKASGKEPGAGESLEKNNVYYILDTPFRKWLSELDPNTGNMEEEKQEIRHTAYRCVYDYGRKIFDNAGYNAVIGRAYTEKNKNKYYAAPDAFNKFRWKLKKCFEVESRGDEQV